MIGPQCTASGFEAQGADSTLPRSIAAAFSITLNWVYSLSEVCLPPLGHPLPKHVSLRFVLYLSDDAGRSIIPAFCRCRWTYGRPDGLNSLFSSTPFPLLS